MAWLVLLTCYLFTDSSQNINWVFGPGEKPQTWLPPELYLTLLLFLLPAGICFPTHLLLQKLFGGQYHKPITSTSRCVKNG
jgi:hypothetical protein